MKIQILYTYPDAIVLEGVLTGFNIPFISVPEMKDDCYLTIIDSEEVTNLQEDLNTPLATMNYIGSYYMDGVQFIWTEPTELDRNHSMIKYKAALDNIVIFDDNNNIIVDRRPTMLEAEHTQVTLIAGYPDRIII